MEIDKESNHIENKNVTPIFSKEFSQKNIELRNNWKKGREVARLAYESINEMIRIGHRDNPDLSVNRIMSVIYSLNTDLEGFAKSTIYKNLDDDNKALLDKSKQSSRTLCSDGETKVIEQGSKVIKPEDYVRIEKEMTPLTDEEIEKVANEPYKLKPGQEQENAIRRGNPEEIAFVPETNQVKRSYEALEQQCERQAQKINELIRALDAVREADKLIEVDDNELETLKVENKKLREDNEGLEEDVRMLREERSRFKGAIATDDEIKLREENEGLREELRYFKNLSTLSSNNNLDGVMHVDLDAYGDIVMGERTKRYPFKIDFDLNIKERKTSNVTIKMGTPYILKE